MTKDPSSQPIDIAELLSQFTTVKVHFVNSQREVLLGFKEVCQILIELSDASRISIGGDFPVYVMKTVVAVIDYFLAKIPERGKAGDILAAKIKAIAEIITIIDDEAQKVGAQARTETDLNKVEALYSIKKYLLSEKKLAEHQQAHPEESARIRKVSID